ncbi:MAG TPA: BTAD domain-containing putative transcriptional regulator [Streptosporangiaceae bacterium]|nr:BTAD domain-containing putative transcriptional regulator [Streptosporangiaceae bacterium]
MPAHDVAEFRVLGPLEVLAGSSRLELAGLRQQIVLAMLLLSANGVVSVGRLEEAIYGQDLPPTSRTQALIAVSALRRQLADRCDDAAIVRRPQGYSLQIGNGQLDSLRFASLVAGARAARDAGDLGLAAANYRDALRLWRGPALAGIDSHLVRVAATGLDEQRIAAIEDRLAVELDLGRHHELVGELSALAEEFPLRDALRGQLMLALYRSGRAAEALEVYQQARRTMIDELGIEPGRELQELQHAILAGDPALDPPAGRVRVPAAPPVPRLLPADIADFTDRADAVGRIHGLLTAAAAADAQVAVPVLAITGQGGVGKTSLAVHAAHGLAPQFEDGQLFADLHGVGAQPTGPAQVLERFLRAMGVPGPQIPDGLEERAEAYRNLLAGRRMLVVLDDAATESQVVPLLPGSGSAAVLVTSRSNLAGLAGATRIRLDVFEARQSLELLGRIAGTSRVQAQQEAAAQVTEQCGHLPLAVRIAGGRLAVRPHWDVRHLAERLADQARRLDELELGELGVRASISLSYHAAGEAARRLLRRLALLDVPVFTGWMSAALLDQPPTVADDVLDELVSARLIEPADSRMGAHSQYRFHDLIRLFARERLAAEEPAAEQRAALERALGALLFLAEKARNRDLGGSYVSTDPAALRWPLSDALTDLLISDPMAWFEQERTALVAGVRQAALVGLVELCWSLAAISVTLFEARSYLDDWQDVTEVALAAARAAGSVRGEAATLHSRGNLCEERGQLVQARQDLDAAARLFREQGDDHSFALAVRLIALTDRIGGRLEAASAGFEQALAILRQTEDQVAVAFVLHNLARVRLESGEPGLARDLLTEALALTRAGHGRRIEAQVLYVTGEAQLQTGELAEAADAFAQALAIVRAVGDGVGEAHILRGVGLAALRQGQHDIARGALEQALELADAYSIPVAVGRARLGLAELALASGEAGQTIVLASHASDSFRDLGAPLEQARALALLGDAYLAAGDIPAAETASAQATALRAGNQPTSGAQLTT